MKGRTIKYSLLLGICCINIFGNLKAETYDTSVTRINKVYKVLNDEERLVINNMFGNVIIKAIKRKEVHINITIFAGAKTPALAKSLSGRVNITTTRNNGQITCTTLITGKDSTTKLKLPLQDEKCTVTYMIYMPAGMRLKITNQFGNIEMNDHTGQLSVEEKFGNFTAGNLSDIDTVGVVLGSIKINRIDKGILIAKGFGYVNIGAISGDVHCFFSGGKVTDIGFTNGHYNFTLESGNVRIMKVHYAKDISAAVTLDAVLCKMDNQSPLVLKEDVQSKMQTDSLLIKPFKKDTSTVNTDKEKIIMSKKKLDLMEALTKRPVHYSGLAGNGDATIMIKAAFSYLHFE